MCVIFEDFPASSSSADVGQVDLKDFACLNFRPMTDADLDVYADVSDPEALIAYTGDETWIVEGDLLRIVRVNQAKLKATQRYFILEPWGDAAEVGDRR